MDADYSIEPGRDDPVLDFPWSDPDGKLIYHDLKHHPELLARIDEAQRFPELAEFLRTVNLPSSMVESVKCDVWTTDELDPDKEVFGNCGTTSYVDLVFADLQQRASFAFHELFAKRLVELLRKTPETPSSAELCVRRCFFQQSGTVTEGFYSTLYVSGYGEDQAHARRNWAIALRLVGNAILQLSASA